MPLLFLVALVAGCGQKNSSRHVELVADTDSPSPAMTFELRFEAVMVRGDRVGLPASDSPLVIRPPLAGTFTWLSPRSGAFTPSEPLALDERYALSLRPGLVCADGRPSDAALHWTIKTPRFGVVAAWPQTADGNAGSQPEIKLAFNADVRASEAGRYLYFRDAAGDRVAADARQATQEDLWGHRESLQTWQEAAAGQGDSEAGTLSSTNEAASVLVVTPQHALPIALGWKLVVGSGLPAADQPLVVRENGSVPVGDVTPFEVETVEAHNYIYSGPAIEIDFSKPVPESLTNHFRDWIELSSEPTNLAIRVSGRRLSFSGNFPGGTNLTLKLRPGFASTEPFTLQGSNTFEVEIPHVAPRLYFPATSQDQLAGGSRLFPLLTVNVSRVRIRAKLMDPATAVHALRGYRSYFASDEQLRKQDWEEPYQAIDYNLVPGSTVFDQETNLGTEARESDAANKLDLSWDELLQGRRAGVVFLDARGVGDDQESALGAQALIQLTDLGVLWKRSAAGVDVFVFSHVTGRPIAGAGARLLSDENQVLKTAVTDASGQAHLAANTNAAWVGVQSGADFHAVRLAENRWKSLAAAPPVPAGDEDPDDRRRVMLFSDRDLYRPGESLHLEAIVRDWTDAGLRVPRKLTGDLQCADTQGRVFFQTNAQLSDLGSWSALVPLPIAGRGFYTARLHLGADDQTNFYSFQVQDFQPSAFEIQLPAKEAYSAGESIALPLSAHYLFGKTLSRARVAWSLQADDLDWRPEKFQNFSFRRSDFEGRYGRGQSSLTLSGRGILTAASNCIIAPLLTINPAAPQPRAVSLLAEVTDVNQQTLSRRVAFIRHSSDFYLGLRQADDVLTSNTPTPLEIVAVGADGKPWPEAVKAHLTLQRIDWQSVRVQGAGKTARYHNEAVFTNILENDVTVAPIAMPGEADEEANGNLITGLPALPAGEYLVEAKSADAAGRPVVSSLEFEVSAPAPAGWNYHNDVQLELEPDRKEYAPGDMAKILVKAPFGGTALVTVEREKVLRSFVTQLQGNAPSVSIPIAFSDVPNVYVSVALLRGSANSPHKIKEPEYRLGSCELSVLDARSRLAVEVVPARANQLPGQPVDVAVRITGSDHEPVAGAEVILYAVDDGILGMTGYALPDPHGFFFAPRSLDVLSDISLPNLLPEDPTELTFANKGYIGGGGGRERVRKNFLACAFWNAALQTDADGRVRVQFTAPDSLTRYQLFAVAHTADNRFGSGQSAFQVTKPLVIEPALPAVANITDHLIARGVVLNQTTNGGDVVVTLELDDKARPAEAGVLTRRISIPAHGSAVVEFPVELTDTGDARWVWRAHFADATLGEFTDAVQSTIPVGHIAPVLGEVLLARVTSSQSNLLALANPQLLAGRGTITVSVANTRLNELGETAAALLHYPYGCAEQTASCLLPWILLRDAHGLLPHFVGTKTNDAAEAIRTGVARLFSMQTRSGGLAYWPRTREPMLWASAYGGMVLAIARQHGVAVPQDDFSSLMDYLSGQLRSTDGAPEDSSDQCLALYALALAGRPEPAYQEKLFDLRKELAPEDRALLALAVAESHGPAGMIRELLQDTSPQSPAESHFDCPAREEAIRLLAWIRYQPGDPMTDRLVDDLMHEQKEARWETTQGNAWGLLALTDYARRVETKLQPAAGRLDYAGQSVAFSLDDRTNVFSQSFTITNLAGAMLSLANASTNCLYTTIAIEARPPELPQPRQDRGISLERRYDRLDDDNQPRDISDLHVGDRVLVTLRLSVHERASYVAVDDALPAILEAVNPEFRTQEARASELADNEGWWACDFRELRQDRYLSFADDVEPGTYVLRYVARVRAAGTVTAPSAKAEEMYHPERCGLSETQTLTSKPLD